MLRLGSCQQNLQKHVRSEFSCKLYSSCHKRWNATPKIPCQEVPTLALENMENRGKSWKVNNLQSEREGISENEHAVLGSIESGIILEVSDAFV